MGPGPRRVGRGLLWLPSRPRFSGLVGTGGIGHGSFLLLEGNDTLGREESRAGRLLDRRDYCKLHIICHYLKVLLGDEFPVYPIGRVGDDDAGSRLRSEMESVGMDLRFVHLTAGVGTLYSVCLVYPDGSGGNVTTADSASSRLDPGAVREAAPLIRELGRKGIVLAVPEVPLAARQALLEMGARHGLLRAASFTREEMREVRASGFLGQVDLCSLNLEEAAAGAGMEVESLKRRPPEEAALEAIRQISRDHPSLAISVTGGAAGSWCRDASGVSFEPALSVDVAGTSGAGDAHFAGLLAGLTAGLSFREAHQLAAIVSSASVTSAHTIHPGMTRDLLRSVLQVHARASARVSALLDSSNARS